MTYFISQPLNGFIDMCCEISKCLSHCITFRRKLIIDTTKSSFRDNIFHYFDINHPCILIKTDFHFFYENQVDYSQIYPTDVTKKDLSHGKPTNLLLDNKKSYKTKFIFRSFGAHNTSLLSLFKIAQLNYDLKKIFLARYALLPKPYVALHIRHTDYKSDVDGFLKKLLSQSYPQIQKTTPIFLATDNYEVLEQFRSCFSNLYSFSSTIPKENKEMIGIHLLSKSNKETQRDCNIDVIMDFLLLIFGSEYYFSCVKSGFSQEVKNLRKHKDIVLKFIGITEEDLLRT